MRLTYEFSEARRFVLEQLKNDPAAVLITTREAWFYAEPTVDRAHIAVAQKFLARSAVVWARVTVIVARSTVILARSAEGLLGQVEGRADDAVRVDAVVEVDIIECADLAESADAEGDSADLVDGLQERQGVWVPVED